MREQVLTIAVVEPRGSGGMIHYAYQMCTALAENGARVILVTSQDYELDDYPHNFSVNKLLKLWSLTDPRDDAHSMTRVGRAVYKIFRNIRRATRGIRFIIEWNRLTFYLLSTKPNIVQFGKIEFPFEAVFLYILRKKGLTLTQICHEFELREQAGNPIANFSNQLYRWVYESFSVLFFHSNNNKERFSTLFNIDPVRFYVIPHGNERLFLEPTGQNRVSEDEMRSRYNIDKSVSVVLFFGNLMPSKGIPDLLAAFKHVHADNSNTQLIVAGKPTKHIDLPSLMQLTREFGIEHSTIFDSRYIPIEEVSPLMEMASVVVYPYLNSTQSGSLQVAYAFGRPVVATNVGGLPDAVEEGKSGFLVPPGDPEQLARAILKFTNYRDRTLKMGAYAKHLSETRFSWDTVAKLILAVYNKL